MPALSSIATRDEMAPLQRLLAARFETVALDWPGFGTTDKPRVAWTPAAMAAWLDHVLSAVVPDPALIVAAGHAAGYLLRHLADNPGRSLHIVLVAPTWRGPLPTMMGRRPSWLACVRAAVDMPVAGPALYMLNLNDLVIGRMARGHVYSDPGWLTLESLAAKRHVARAAGARFASVRFVTGALDPFDVADDARSAAAAMPKDRLQLIWGEETPRKSKTEMEALAAAASIAPTLLPRGKLGLHEEFANDVAQVILGRFANSE
nr:alpha/beta hydrolase [Acuticoccus mangrovi]